MMTSFWTRGGTSLAAVRAAVALGCLVPLMFAVSRSSIQGKSPEEERVEEIPYHEGDLLQVRVPAGVVDVQTWSGNAVQARWTEPPTGDSKRPRISFLRQGGKIFLIASSHANLPVAIELRVPPQADLFVQAIQADVTVKGAKGIVAVKALRGRIDIADSTGYVYVFSRAGEIHYHVKEQPPRPALLLTGGANVYCDVPKDIQVDVEISTARNSGPYQKVIQHEPVDCATSHGKRPCLTLVSGEDGRSYLFQADKTTAKPGPPAALRTEPRKLANLKDRLPLQAAPPPDSEGPSRGDIPSFHVNVDWVRLNLSVAERRGGGRILGLKPDDFEVYEDGILQEIQSLQGTEEPFHLLVLLDVSGSTASYLPVLKRAVRAFAGTLRSEDRLALAAFNYHPFLVRGFTNSKRSISGALKKLPAGGGTGFYEALHFGLDYLSGVTGRKALVVFTDGVDETLYGRVEQAANLTFPDVFEEVKETDALVYAISLDSRKLLQELLARGDNQPLVEPVLREARSQLQAISDHSGTILYSPTRPGELGSIFAEIAGDLKSRYTIAYRSNNPVKDGRWRTLTVKIANHPDYAVRTRRGYYASDSPLPAGADSER